MLFMIVIPRIDLGRDCPPLENHGAHSCQGSKTAGQAASASRTRP